MTKKVDRRPVGAIQQIKGAAQPDQSDIKAKGCSLYEIHGGLKNCDDGSIAQCQFQWMTQALSILEMASFCNF
jgi:hypothetical protein